MPGGGTSPTEAPPANRGTTNASGTLVDDATGAPLSGVRVTIEPWTAAATPLPSPQATTDANGQFALSGAANGHYLLVIVSDTPGGTTVATIHDNVTFTGGNQSLRAPVLPAIPGYNAPVWETNGSYRLATLNAATKVPCYTAWNADRTQHSLSPAVPDEWLIEKVRAIWGYYNAGATGLLPPNAGAISSYNVVSTGAASASCDGDVTFAFSAAGPTETAATSAHTTWLGAIHASVATGGYSGVAIFPYDPRFQADPNAAWP